MDCFHHRSGGTGRNVIIFGVDVSSSIKIDSRKKDILISWQKSYTNFTEQEKQKVLFELNSYLFVNSREIYKFKVKYSEIVVTPLCLEKISKDWTVDNMKKTGLNRYVYEFSAAYDAIAVDDVLDIKKYLMKKNNLM